MSPIPTNSNTFARRSTKPRRRNGRREHDASPSSRCPHGCRRWSRHAMSQRMRRRRVVSTIDRHSPRRGAISVEEQLRPKVEQLTKDGKATDPLRQEIAALTAQVQGLINQAEIERSAAQFEELKTRINAAATVAAASLFDKSTSAHAGGEAQVNPKAQSPDGPNQSALAAETRWTLIIQRDRMINLANPSVRRADSTGNLKDQLVSLLVEVKSAEANFENAKLEREIAEIAITEYEQGTFVRDKAALKVERLLADSDVKRKRDQVELAKDQLARVKSSSMNLPADRARESRVPTFWQSRRSTCADRSLRWQVLSQKSRPSKIIRSRNGSRSFAPGSRRPAQRSWRSKPSGSSRRPEANR